MWRRLGSGACSRQVVAEPSADQAIRYGEIWGDMGRYACSRQVVGGKAECRPGHQRLAADHVGEGAVEADEEEGD